LTSIVFANRAWSWLTTGLVGRVGAVPHGALAAQGGGGQLRGLLRTARQDDVRPGVQERLGDGQADAARGTRDDRCPVRELAVHDEATSGAGLVPLVAGVATTCCHRRSSRWAIVRLCTSSGPSARRNVRWSA
jgi:hypothetical protein